MIVQEEIDYSLRWAIDHPDLLGRSILKALSDYPLDCWDYELKQSHMPGMAFSLIITQKLGREG